MLATLLPRYICIARVEFLWCCMQQQLQEQRLYTCHMHTYIRTTSMTATSSCSTAKLLQFVCKIVLQIEQERWRKQKAQSLLHTHRHTYTYTHGCKLVQSGTNKLACRISLDFSVSNNCNSKRASASAWACRLSEILIDTHNLFCQIPSSCMIV